MGHSNQNENESIYYFVVVVAWIQNGLCIGIICDDPSFFSHDEHSQTTDTQNMSTARRR